MVKHVRCEGAGRRSWSYHGCRSRRHRRAHPEGGHWRLHCYRLAVHGWRGVRGTHSALRNAARGRGHSSSSSSSVGRWRQHTGCARESRLHGGRACSWQRRNGAHPGRSHAPGCIQAGCTHCHACCAWRLGVCSSLCAVHRSHCHCCCRPTNAWYQRCSNGRGGGHIHWSRLGCEFRPCSRSRARHRWCRSLCACQRRSSGGSDSGSICGSSGGSS